MCGISGFCSFDIDFTKRYDYWENILVKMREAIYRRGNDTTGEYLNKNIGLRTILSQRVMFLKLPPIQR